MGQAKWRALLLGGVLVVWAWTHAQAEIAVSANDTKPMLGMLDGIVRADLRRGPDNLTIIEIGGRMPKVIAQLDNVPTSEWGPPTSVAITPDESLALVSAASKIAPGNPASIVPNNVLTVVDLKATPPAVIATLKAGPGAAGISINKQGTLALVANHGDGTVSVFTISGKRVTPAGKLDTKSPGSGPVDAAFSPDGTFALLTRSGDNVISVVSIQGTKLKIKKRSISAGIGPAAIEIAPNGKWAVVANSGTGVGDADTVSLIDLTQDPPRVVDTLTVGQSPEHVTVSRDSKWIAVSVQNGSNRKADSGYAHPHGKAMILEIRNGKLTQVADADQGAWPQGVAFSHDGKTLLAGNMAEHSVWVYSWDGKVLKKQGEIPVHGGSAGLRVAGGN